MFDFVPQVLIFVNQGKILSKDKDTFTVSFTANYDDGNNYERVGTNTITFDGNTISWYISAISMGSLSSVKNLYTPQYNTSGTTYYYIAIG